MQTAPVASALLRLRPLLAAAVVAAAGCGTLDPAQGITFVEPADGDTVTSPFRVRLGVKGRTLTPAGTASRLTSKT
jgi:hypothetical protein